MKINSLIFVKQKYDINATSDVKTEEYGEVLGNWVKERYDNDNIWRVTSGFIKFNYKEEERLLFYYKSNINSYENLKFYSRCGLQDMVKSETTSISLGCWGNSVEIIKDIVVQFGGWIDENDCDDKEYYPVVKNEDGSIKPVIYVTIEEINKKFGGVVIVNYH